MNNKEIIRRLYIALKPYKKRFVVAMLSMVVVGLLQPSLIALIKPFFDIILHPEAAVIPVVGIKIPAEMPRETLLFYFSFIILILAVLRGVFHYIQKYYMAYIGQNIVKDLRNRLFRHLCYQSMGYFMLNRTGQLMSRLTNDVKYIEKSVVKIPTQLIRDGITFIFTMVLLFYLNWRWAFYAIAGFIFILVPFTVFSRMLRKLARAGHRKMADIYDFLSEKISGMRLIKAFSMEREEQRNMRSVNKKFLDLILKSEKINAFQSPISEFLSTMGMVVIIILGGMALIKGSVTMGTLLAFMGALSAMYTPVKHLSGINQELQRALAAAERIYQVLDDKNHILQSENPIELDKFKDKIEFKNVSFAYDYNEYVLKDVNLKIRKGDIAAFVGPSGAGKTTLVNLVPRFFDIQQGSISIDGRDIREYFIKSLRGAMSMVMQDVILFNMSVKENICYGLGEFTREEVQKYARAANAHEFISALPQGYDTVVGEKGIRLSGGQKQRISIARALIKDPEILILDEATAHLDTESEIQVQDALDKLMANRTTLVIAHRLSTVRKADMIFVLDSGKIIERGRHEELLGFEGLYRRMFEIQSL
ncbi:MAG: ABC transporter ATP-binding protein [Elusimicrobiota bacterium]